MPLIIDLSSDECYVTTGVQSGRAYSPNIELELKEEYKLYCEQQFKNRSEELVRFFVGNSPDKNKAVMESLTKIPVTLRAAAMMNTCPPGAKTTTVIPMSPLRFTRAEPDQPPSPAPSNGPDIEEFVKIYGSYPDAAIKYDSYPWKEILQNFHKFITIKLQRSLGLSKKLKVASLTEVQEDIKKYDHARKQSLYMRNRILANIFYVCLYNENNFSPIHSIFMRNVLTIINKNICIKELIQIALERPTAHAITKDDLKLFICIDRSYEEPARSAPP
jgi:hypothetical protein